LGNVFPIARAGASFYFSESCIFSLLSGLAKCPLGPPAGENFLSRQEISNFFGYKGLQFFSFLSTFPARTLPIVWSSAAQFEK
jgi:hypothetical protein